MTGSYILQIDKHKFNNNSIDPTCPLCKADDETIIHLITTCPILSCIREKHFTIIKEIILKKLTSQTWTEICNTKLAITKLVIDCTSFEGCIGNDNVLMSEIYQEFSVPTTCNQTKRYKGSITRLIHGQNQLERIDAISNLQKGI
jgi:hypothetical protein